jgi:hypothetical protein
MVKLNNFDDFEGICTCSSGIFDIDCSIDSLLIPFGTPTKKNIPALSWAYFYFPIQSKRSENRSI